MNYRFKRRAFLATLGGAVGLETMLGNLEAAAVGTPSPPRLLAATWPVGTIRHHYLPVGAERDFTMSRILMPFEERGLREDLVILYGLNHYGMTTQGGGPEGGTVMMMTGANSPGTRQNGGETDDPVAGGPSFDQIFLKHAPVLARPGQGYASAIADARVDSNETSTQCLSYSHTTRSVDSARPGGPITEHVPLLPKLSPIDLYTETFGSFEPGGSDAEQMLKRARLRQSVLDGTRGQLARLHDLAPASEREKIDIHTDAIRKVELELSDYLAGGGDCATPAAPDPSLQGKSGSEYHYGDPIADAPDTALVEQIGKLHLSLIRAAFQCDLMRVATFQWCPTQPHLAFENLDPAHPETFYMHHPLSHRAPGPPSFFSGEPPAAGDSLAYLYEAMVRANTWYFEKYADVFSEWKTAVDGFGGALLDHTVIPLMTDTANATHARNPLPALILGGHALGIRGGQFQNLESATRSHNALWMTVAQAFFPDSTNVLDEMPDEVFVREGVAPIDGIWVRPA